ncbi:DUF6252 family protein [Aquimarina sp. 2201CG5-10]|uniref:DUF6252 family protein n=1 Tax=Aquimarina callyspongiae TaxID=3098150 RepID=UPI002AB5BC4B|nr:DUF6252 family protein [Aquimarina sp. 2201CG5-10]MDY8134800.1 DUF6252 family protein [Aquimarina sp. 2201CG5-10]
MIRKTTLLLAIICLVFNSCSTDIEVNTPAFQATKNGELFRASIRKAVIHDDGSLVITGSLGPEHMSFTTTSTDLGKYRIGMETPNKASFQTDNGKFFIEDQESEGEIEITEILNNEVSGNFYFKNLKDTNGNSVDFLNGWFYKIPLENFVDETSQVINPCLLDASLTANIDGSEMITDNHTASIFGVDDVSVLIKASNDTEEITIVFPNNVTPGDYSLSGSGDYSATYSLNDDKSSALSGQLTITYHDTEIKCISGSFEFTTRSGVTVSEGSFDFGY